MGLIEKTVVISWSHSQLCQITLVGLAHVLNLSAVNQKLLETKD